MNRIRSAVVVAVLGFLAASGAHAGPYADDLSRCLVEGTTPQDRTSLVQWMFMAASRHPDVSSIVSVTDEQLDEANGRLADLLMRLLTESCREATAKAVKYEGESTLETGFGILGQVAGKELFGNAEVQASISGMEEYLDDAKLKSIVESN